jgi:hypothetical protein
VLLRSDERAAVARVYRHLARLADGYRDAARLAQLRRWPALAGMFHALAAERAAMRRRVAALVEALGGAARDPALARRARLLRRGIGLRLRSTRRRVRALLGADHQPGLVRRLERSEDSLAAAIAAALALDLPDRVSAPLRRIRAAMDRARRELAEARIALVAHPVASA